MRSRQLEAGKRKLSRGSSRAEDELVRLQPRRVVALNRVRIGEPRRPGMLMDRHPRPLEVVAQQRVRAHVLSHLADASQQTAVVHRQFTYRDSVARQKLRLTDQTRGLCERPHRDGPSLAAMPPKSSRVTSAARAPSLAALRAATTPAGPAPMTTTSSLSVGDEAIETIIK